MPTRKQRRRRAKDRRHEYEYVYVDEEGNEVEYEPDDEPRKQERSPAKQASRGRGGRPARVVQPPSWSRVGKRMLLFAPLILLWVLFVGRGGHNHKHTATAALVVQALFLLVILGPVIYMTDSFAYRSYLKRTGQAPQPARKKRGAGES